jgi:hypothetical protein
MKKEELVKLGVPEEIADKVADATKAELDGYVPKTRLDEVIRDRDKLKTSLAERDGQLEELKKSGSDVETMKQSITALQEANKEKDKQHEAELRKVKVDSAVEKALLAANARNLVAAKALLPPELLEKGELAEDGALKGLSDVINKLVTSDDTKFLFEDRKLPPVGPKPGEKKDGIPGANPQGATLTDAIKLALQPKE